MFKIVKYDYAIERFITNQPSTSIFPFKENKARFSGAHNTGKGSLLFSLLFVDISTLFQLERCNLLRDRIAQIFYDPFFFLIKLGKVRFF